MYPESVEYLNRQQIIPKLRRWTLGATIYIFFSFFTLCECVCVCFFVWFCLYSFAFTICPGVLSVHFFFFFFSIVFSACYHWWTCFLVSLLCSFFLFFSFFLLLFTFLLLIIIFYFNNFILFSFFLPFFFSPFSSEPYGWQGLGAPAGCQACASEVGEPSSGHWSTRDLPATCNIKWRKLSQRSPSQC